MTVSDVLEMIEEKLAEAEVKMAHTTSNGDYRYIEGQIEALELLREHLENLEE